MIYYTSTPDYYNDYIAHYGVKGMRWGIRRRQLISGGMSRRMARRQVKLEKMQAKYDNKVKKTKSLRAGYHNLIAKANGANAKFYSKGKSRFAKQMAGMNKAAQRSSSKRAESILNKKKSERQAKYNEKIKSYKANKITGQTNNKTKKISNTSSGYHNLLAKINGINAKFYSQGNSRFAKQMASMNKAAQAQNLQKAKKKKKS